MRWNVDNIPQRLEDLSQSDLALEVISIVRGHLDHRDVKGLLRWKHELERHPDAVVDTALHALGLDSCLDQVLPNFHGEIGCILVRPIVLVNEGSRVVEVANKVVLGK
jgi:hypothetical protein